MGILNQRPFKSWLYNNPDNPALPLELSHNNAASHSPAKPCNTVHSDAAARFLSKLVAEQLEPVFHDLVGRRGTIIKGPVLEEIKEERVRVCEACKLDEHTIRMAQMCVCQLLPGPVSPPSLLEPYHRWHHKLSPACSRRTFSAPGRHQKKKGF